MTQNPKRRMFHCAKDTFGLPFRIERKLRMYGTYRKVQVPQNGIGKVERAILEDIDLCGFQQPEIPELGVQAVDPGHLSG